MASATVFAIRTANITGTVYESVPVSSLAFPQQCQGKEMRKAGKGTDNMMTAKLTVVLVTPASVAAAPTIAHCTLVARRQVNVQEKGTGHTTPGMTQA
jgi:hypothetical protein